MNQDILSISIFVFLLFPHEFSLFWSVIIEEKACFFNARLSLKSTYQICPAQLRRLLSLVMMVSLASTWSLVGKSASAQLKRRRRQSDTLIHHKNTKQRYSFFRHFCFVTISTWIFTILIIKNVNTKGVLFTKVLSMSRFINKLNLSRVFKIDIKEISSY